MSEAMPAEALCSACSELKKGNLEAHLLRSVTGKEPAEGRGCQRCARLALKELNIGDDKDMAGSRMEMQKTTTKKNPRPDETESYAGSEESPKKRRKKVRMRMSDEYVEYLEKHPPSALFG